MKLKLHRPKVGGIQRKTSAKCQREIFFDFPYNPNPSF